MAAYSRSVWSQPKARTADDLIRGLKKDGWKQEETRGATLSFAKHVPHPRIVVVHYHPKKSYGPKLLKRLLDDIGWDEEDLKRLKLIK